LTLAFDRHRHTEIGTLLGTAIFPSHLVDGLRDREAVVEIADQFFEKFARM
jgi:hypothetical protein